MADAPEDKRIMVERERLERVWLNTLTDTQRAAWLALWTTTPPLDANLRAYIPTTPTTRGQVQVLPQTAYAWSQIFGTLRYAAAPILTPVAATRPTFTLQELVIAPTSWILLLESNTPLPTGARVILYGTEGVDQLLPGMAWRLRPLVWWEDVFTPSLVDVFAVWSARFTANPGQRVMFGVGIVDANNMFTGAAAQCVITAPTPTTDPPRFTAAIWDES